MVCTCSRNCSGIRDAQIATFNSFPMLSRVNLKYVVCLLFSRASCMGSCSGMQCTGEFFPLMLHLHSIHLSPLGKDFAKDMAHSSSPSFVPRNSFLNGLLGGWRKKSLMQWHTVMIVLRSWKFLFSFRPSVGLWRSLDMWWCVWTFGVWLIQ